MMMMMMNWCRLFENGISGRRGKCVQRRPVVPSDRSSTWIQRYSRNHWHRFRQKLHVKHVASHPSIFTSAEEGGYVFGSVCLSVCLSVRLITRKLVNGFCRNFLEGQGMAQGQSDTILVAIRITLQIRESKVRNLDPPDRRRFVLSEHRFLVSNVFCFNFCLPGPTKLVFKDFFQDIFSSQT